MNARLALVPKLLQSVAALALLSSGVSSLQISKAQTVSKTGAHSRVSGTATPNGISERNRAHDLVTYSLREGNRRPFVAEQTTRLLNGRVSESQVIVKHGARGEERIEFLSPPSMRGDIILRTAGRIWNYKPSEHRIYEGIAPDEVLLDRSRRMMDELRGARIQMAITGQEAVAGHNASIVEMQGPNGGRRLWIDEKSGVRLRSEVLNAQGTVVQTSYFTKIDFNAVPLPGEFLPASLPRVRHDALLPTRPPLPDVRTAQRLVSYPIHEPAVPDGFKLTGVWVSPVNSRREITILRYNDGAATFALFQQPLPNRMKVKGVANNRVRRQPGSVNWAGRDRLYNLLGDLPREAVKRVVDSLR